MALTGTQTRSMDEKLRVAVPRPMRDEFGEDDLSSLVVAPGTEKSLVVYSPKGFERLASKLSEQSTSRIEVRNYLRLFYARAEKVNLDSQGRIRIPDRLVTFAGLQRSIVLIGVHDHIEIWDQDTWESFLTEVSPAFDEMASRALE